MDQAQHFGALGSTASGAASSQTGEDFREGLDATERERQCIPFLFGAHVLRTIPQSVRVSAR